MTIQAPQAFRNLTSWFGEDLIHPGFDLDQLNEIVNTSVGAITAEEAPEVIAFIDDVLAKTYPPGELVDFWYSTPTSIYVEPDEGVRTVLKMIRDAVDAFWIKGIMPPQVGEK